MTRLAAILRVADLRILVDAGSGRFPAEWAAERKSDLFEEVLGRTL